MKKTFKLEEVLSAIQGRLLCPISKVYEVLNFLTGDNLYTHQLPRAGRVCQDPVFNQHPFLRDIDVTGISPENWEEQLSAIKAKYPNEIELTPLSEYQIIDPIEEMEQTVGKDRVIVAYIENPQP
jgi:hypothetical protein